MTTTALPTSALDRLAEGVTILGADGERVYANAAAAAILATLGTGSRQIGTEAGGARDAQDRIVPPEQLPAELTRRTGEEFSDSELGFAAPDGTLRWIRCSTRRLSDDGPPFTVLSSFTDVTATVTELRDSRDRFAGAFADAPTGMALVATDGRFLQVNQALAELVGMAPAELETCTFQDITHPDDLHTDLALLEETLAGRRRTYEMAKRYLRADGEVIWIQLSVAAVRDAEDRVVYLVSHIQDITDRRALEERLTELADRDSLTGLLNRRRFGEELERQLARSARRDEGAVLVMIDLDRFKAVNDRFGHAEGDLVLATVAQALESRVREADTLARLGGDEFAALLVGVAPDRTDDVVAALGAAADRGAAHGVTASLGATRLRRGDRPDEVLARADRAMYEAKRAKLA